MKLIKLNAIDSTNEYIKKIKSYVSDKLFCVYTYSQTKGKGQRGNIWESEPNKNICISICFKPLTCEPNYTSFKLNMLVSLIILEFFEELKIPKLKVKWPNDILSDGKKISGILIETSYLLRFIVIITSILIFYFSKRIPVYPSVFSAIMLYFLSRYF